MTYTPHSTSRKKSGRIIGHVPLLPYPSAVAPVLLHGGKPHVVVRRGNGDVDLDKISDDRFVHHDGTTKMRGPTQDFVAGDHTLYAFEPFDVRAFVSTKAGEFYANLMDEKKTHLEADPVLALTFARLTRESDRIRTAFRGAVAHAQRQFSRRMFASWHRRELNEIDRIDGTLAQELANLKRIRHLCGQHTEKKRPFRRNFVAWGKTRRSQDQVRTRGMCDAILRHTGLGTA